MIIRLKKPKDQYRVWDKKNYFEFLDAGNDSSKTLELPVFL